MAEGVKLPGYMAQLLEALGWNQGTRIPLADEANQELENLLVTRQHEIQRLKETVTAQKQKRDDLNKYKSYVHSEYQENTQVFTRGLCEGSHPKDIVQSTLRFARLAETLSLLKKKNTGRGTRPMQDGRVLQVVENGIYKRFMRRESSEGHRAVYIKRLLFAHKQQMEQEVKLRQLSCNEADRLDRDVIDCSKQSKDISNRIDRLQTTIARLLKKADSLKGEVCGERGALQEWRAALERNACDISAIEQFTKQDLSKAKALETKRQKLKHEHDRMHERLVQLVTNLSAEERASDRISVQVMEGMEQRKQMMTMWTSAIENLRQRDKDIRHIREDYAVLEAEGNNLAEKSREQQAFCDQQRGNNSDAQQENMLLAQRLSQTRMTHQQLVEHNATLDSETQSLQRELSNMRVALERLHMENRQIMEDQHRKDMSLHSINQKIKELKEKLTDSLDKSKSSEKRAKELEDMLNEEERYGSQLTTNQQRAMHCSFIEQQNLLALKNEEKLFTMQVKASKAIMSKLDSKQRGVQRDLQSQKETLYGICYQLETIGARVAHMEGVQAERECSMELVEKENRLKEVCARHAARVALLERHAGKLNDDMRRLARDLETRAAHLFELQSRLKSSMLNVEGGDKELRVSRDTWRRTRVDEALLRLRVAHAARALAGLDDAAFTLDEQRLHLDAAMNERLVEIKARRDMFSVQKRALFEDCGKLRSEIREREQRIDQLKKRYDIFIGSLGKDDSGQQLSVTYFKIKFAAMRAELRERGAALDADIARRERDVSALEATLRVVHAAHNHFLHHISPLKDDAPEIEELNKLTDQYFALRDELKHLNANISQMEQLVSDTSSRLTLISDKCKQLSAREAETEQELEDLRGRMQQQENRLQNARDVVKNNAKRAQKLVEGVDDWRIFQMSLWTRDYAEAAHNALGALTEACAGAGAGASAAAARLAALVASTDLQRHLARHQRRLYLFLQKILSDKSLMDKKESCIEMSESVFSTSSESAKSGLSIASGYTRRLAAFRRSLAPKVQEKALIEDISATARRSTVSLRVVTLGAEESLPSSMFVSTMSVSKRKSQ